MILKFVKWLCPSYHEKSHRERDRVVNCEKCRFYFQGYKQCCILGHKVKYRLDSFDNTGFFAPEKPDCYDFEVK